jgi:hypothetical protein
MGLAQRIGNRYIPESRQRAIYLRNYTVMLGKIDEASPIQRTNFRDSFSGFDSRTVRATGQQESKLRIER